MLKALLDTSTFVDIGRAVKHTRAPWAQNTLRHLLDYKADHSQLALSTFTVFEHLDGLHRDGQFDAAKEFSLKVLPQFEIIETDQNIIALGAEINATPAKARQTIGLVDCLIAATAICRNLTLINSNTRHFLRVIDHGYPLTLENWRVERPIFPGEENVVAS